MEEIYFLSKYIKSPYLFVIARNITSKMNNKKISVILPVYNGADHVSKSINSILSQTYTNWELIIVNDCSTDNTLQIIQEFERNDSRIHVYSNERNMKLPTTLNVGFSHATGDYFTWTSDDNMYKPTAFEKLVTYLIEHPDISMVYTDYTCIDINENQIGKGCVNESKYMVTGNVFGACFMYTAEIAKIVGAYDSNLFLAEDYDYWIRIARHGKIDYLMEDLYLYRFHAGSLTETKKASINHQTYKTIEKNFLFMYTFAKKHHLTNDFFNHMLLRNEQNIDTIKPMLCDVDFSYRIYLYKENIKKFIKRIFPL